MRYRVTTVPAGACSAHALTNVYPWRVVGDVIHGLFFVMRHVGGFQGRPRFEFHRDALDRKITFLSESDAHNMAEVLNKLAG